MPFNPSAWSQRQADLCVFKASLKNSVFWKNQGYIERPCLRAGRESKSQNHGLRMFCLGGVSHYQIIHKCTHFSKCSFKLLTVVSKLRPPIKSFFNSYGSFGSWPFSPICGDFDRSQAGATDSRFNLI